MTVAIPDQDLETTFHFLPNTDRILVSPIEPESQIGSIILPDQAREKPQWGIVEAVGPGRYADNGQLIPVAAKPGDRVLFGKYSGTEVKIAGEGYIVMKDSDILGFDVSE